MGRFAWFRPIFAPPKLGGHVVGSTGRGRQEGVLEGNVGQEPFAAVGSQEAAVVDDDVLPCRPFLLGGDAIQRNLDQPGTCQVAQFPIGGMAIPIGISPDQEPCKGMVGGRTWPATMLATACGLMVLFGWARVGLLV